MIEIRTLVDARLYPNEAAVLQDALRSLLNEKPQLRIELAIHSYQTQDISLAKAAHLAGVSFDRMKAILVARGIQPRLGPTNEAEAQAEVIEMRRILGTEGD